MEKVLDRINEAFGHIVDLVNRRKTWIWSMFFVVIALSAVGVTRFSIVSDDDAFFGKDDPVKKAYDNFRQQFGGSDTIYIVYRAKDGDVLSEASLQAVKQVQDELLYYRLNKDPGDTGPLDRVTRVRTLINAPYLERKGDALISRPFIGAKIPKTEAERERVRSLALADPAYRSSLLSQDRAYGGIVITTDFGRLLEKHNTAAAAKAKPARAPAEDAGGFDGNHIDPGQPEFEAAKESDEKGYLMQKIATILERYPALEYYPVGEPAVVDYLLKTQAVQIAMEVGAMLTIVVILLAVFRSFSAVVWPVVIISVALLVSVGLIGWTQATMTNIFVLMVIIVWVNGVGITTHMLSHYLQHRGAGVEHRQALTMTMKVAGFDSFVMSLTTVIGLLSLVTVPLVPMRNVGIFSAIGFGVILLLTLFVFPLMLNVWRPQPRPEGVGKSFPSLDKLVSRMFLAVSDFVLACPRRIVFVFAALALVFAYGATRLEVDSNIANFFPRDTNIRQGFELSDRHMAGSTGLEILIDGHSEDTLKDPAVLNAMESLQSFLVQTYPQWIRKTYSTADVVKKTHQAFAGGEGEEGYVIPQKREVLEQTFFMFSIADAKTRRDWVADDYSRGRIRVSMRAAGNKAQLEILQDAQTHIDTLFSPLKQAHPKLEVRMTGGAILQARLDDYVSRSQAMSFGLTMAVVSVLLLAVIGSVKVGALAIVSNLFPVLATFGLMGLLGFPLTVDSAFSAPVIVGVSVDDTIRFLMQYRRSYKKHGNVPDAIRSAICEVGPGLLFASAILASGFVIIMGFPLLTVATMGMFTAIAIATALVSNVVLMPALLQVTDRARARKAAQESAAGEGCPLPVGGGVHGGLMATPHVASKED